MRMRHLRASVVVVFGTLCAACGDGDASASIDGGRVDGANAGFMPTPPVIPWWDDDAGTGMPPIAPPVLTPCPAGWREATTENGIVYCDPWPETGPAVCPEGQAHFVGDPGCTSIGAPCPAGDFPADVPAGATVRYVRAGATGGDGSEAAPFGTVGEALAGAPVGTVIAIAKGRYDEMVRPPAGVTLLGACAAETILTQTAGVAPGTPGGALYASAPGIVAKNLSVADAALIGVWVQSPGTLELDGVIVSRATTQGILVLSGASLVARELVVRDTRPRVRDSEGGNGIGTETGGTIDLTRAILERNIFGGIFALGGTLRARDLVVRQTAPHTTMGIGGHGIGGEARSTLELERVVLEDNRFIALASQGIDATMQASDVVVRRTLPQMSDGKGGGALAAINGAVVTASRVLAISSYGSALYANGGATLNVDDAVVVDVAPPPADPTGGQGAFAMQSAMTLRRAVFARTSAAAAGASGPGVVVLEDLLLDEIIPAGDGIPAGSAMIAADGADVTWRRGAVTNGRASCNFASGVGTRLVLEDVLIRDCDSNPMGIGFGVGVAALDAARLETRRVVVTGAQGISGFAEAAATIDLVDTIFRGGRPVPDHLSYGKGVQLQTGAAARLERVRIADHHGFSLVAVDNSSITGTDVAVVGTRQLECASTSCPDRPGGTAIATILRSSITLDGFVVDGADLCGIQVATAASADLVRGEVRGAEIGACIQVPDFDLARLSSDVSYYDNGTDLQATSLPVPDADPPPPPPTTGSGF